jgi:hypothetical protein
MLFTDNNSYITATSSSNDDESTLDDITIAGPLAVEQGYDEEIEDLEDESIEPDDELEETLTDDQNADDDEANPDDQDIRLPKSEVSTLIGDKDSQDINDDEAWEEREEVIEAADEE